MKLVKAVFFINLCLIITSSNANEKVNIISKLNRIENIQFKFTQKTNDKMERGKCILVFPDKLKCNYDDKNKKELIINKKIMAITQRRYGKTLLYPLTRSNFINILSKNQLIKIINESNIIIDDYLNIIIINENNSKTLIRFNKKDFLLAGWITSDQYNNQIIFEIKIISTNQIIDNKIFDLPKKS